MNWKSEVKYYDNPVENSSQEGGLLFPGPGSGAAVSIAETISEKTQIRAIQQKAREKIAEEKATFDTSLPPATGWEFAGQLYPRIPFPWEVCPATLLKVSKNLAGLAPPHHTLSLGRLFAW